MSKEPLTKGEWWKIARFWVFVCFIMLAVLIVLGVAFGPITCGIRAAQKGACLQEAHQIAVALYAYAQDHNGKYPEGKTSTEVFQHLIDEQYVSDPNLFYVEYLRVPGKVPPLGTKLTSANVSWDITSDVDSSSPDKLPVVFLSGYTITYQAGAAAVVAHPPPLRTWEDWWNGLPAWEPFMAVVCKDTAARGVIADKDGRVPNFIPADFDPKGKTYRQLTP